jgi:hypothetical protein
MAPNQSNTALLNDPVAQELLQSSIPVRLAYTWTDGTPRAVPIWFMWNGEEFLINTPARAPEVKALQHNPRVALTIDDVTWPYKILTVRGNARVELIDGLTAEYPGMAEHYLGEEGGRGFIEFYRGAVSRMARITVRPEWVSILDCVTRFPSALSQ